MTFTLPLGIVLTALCFRVGRVQGEAQALSTNAPAPVDAQHDGSHDFDFVIGNWKAHVRRLPDRLVGSQAWIEYDGISNHKKLLDSNSNLEEFEVDNAEKHLHINGRSWCGTCG
jgi:hypothetical protein